MGDRILLTGMRFYGFHGVFPEETRLGQTFIVDVELSADLREAGRLDDLKKTVDYGKVYLAVREVVEGRPFKLIEALAERIAVDVLGAFPVSEIVVRVHKPQAPIPGAFNGVTVEIRRQKE